MNRHKVQTECSVSHDVLATDELEAAAIFVREVVTKNMFHLGENYTPPGVMNATVNNGTTFCIYVSDVMMRYIDIEKMRERIESLEQELKKEGAVANDPDSSDLETEQRLFHVYVKGMGLGSSRDKIPATSGFEAAIKGIKRFADEEDDIYSFIYSPEVEAEVDGVKFKIDAVAALGDYEVIAQQLTRLRCIEQDVIQQEEELDQLAQLAEKAREEFDIEIGQCNPLVVFEELIESYSQDLVILKKNADGWAEEESKVRKLEAVIEYLESKLKNS